MTPRIEEQKELAEASPKQAEIYEITATAKDSMYTFQVQVGRHSQCNGITLSGKWFDCSSTAQELNVKKSQPSCMVHVDTYAKKYNVSADLMRRIITAESGGNPYAKNSVSTASGCAQFVRGTWNSTLAQMGRKWVSPFDGEANVEAMAFKISRGGIRAWNASKHNWK